MDSVSHGPVTRTRCTAPPSAASGNSGGGDGDTGAAGGLLPGCGSGGGGPVGLVLLAPPPPLPPAPPPLLPVGLTPRKSPAVANAAPPPPAELRSGSAVHHCAAAATAGCAPGAADGTRTEVKSRRMVWLLLRALGRENGTREGLVHVCALLASMPVHFALDWTMTHFSTEALKQTLNMWQCFDSSKTKRKQGLVLPCRPTMVACRAPWPQTPRVQRWRPMRLWLCGGARGPPLAAPGGPSRTQAAAWVRREPWAPQAHCVGS